jgi:hypothetical protein
MVERQGMPEVVSGDFWGARTGSTALPGAKARDDAWQNREAATER